jgi:hypothetical protein
MDWVTAVQKMMRIRMTMMIMTTKTTTRTMMPTMEMWRRRFDRLHISTCTECAHLRLAE